MKKCLLFIWMIVFTMSIHAKDFNSDQLALRKNIVSFLKEEGYVPELDSDGDVVFKSEGKKYLVIISEANKSPMYLVLYHGYLYDDSFTKSNVERVAKEINLYKGLKLYTTDDSYSFRIEMYLVNAEHFRYTFYKHMSIIKDANKELNALIEKMK